MIIKQVSVFVENQPGRLAEMLKVLRDQNINIGALSVADGPDFGIVRIVFEDIERGLAALRQGGFTVRTTDVLKAEIPDKPGGLLESIVQPLAAAGINVEYVYAFVDPTPGIANVVLKVRDVVKAEQLLKSR